VNISRASRETARAVQQYQFASHNHTDNRWPEADDEGRVD